MRRFTVGVPAATVVLALLAFAQVARATDPEIEELRRAVREMQRTIEVLNRKIDRLEREKAHDEAAAREQAEPLAPAAPAVARAKPPAAPSAAAPAPAVAAPPAAVAAAPPEPVAVAPVDEAQGAAPAEIAEASAPEQVPAPPMPPTSQQAAEGYAETVLTSQGIGPQAPIDPGLRGFLRIPNTRVLIRFNAKPRVDFTYDPENTGDDDRFVTAKIPVFGSPEQGGGPVFNANAKGSQLVIDVRAPEIDGSPRFYYQNDFYGSGGGEFPYRVQQLFGSIYDVTVGQTFSPFEDPDVWPDTVDYEGPNAMIFARYPSVRYRLGLVDGVAMNFGLAQPSSDVASTTDDAVQGQDHAPDFALNLRGESDLGHLQLGTVYRYLGAKSDVFGEDTAFGWGVNLSGGLNLPLPWSRTDQDLLLAQGTYGAGIGRYGNDTSFSATDAVFNARGQLVPLPYYGAFLGYTHRWLPDWRSTATYGWVKLDGPPTRGATAYRQTQYASVNLVWQLRERLSVGVEALYGDNQQRSGSSGDAFRTQVGVAYSLF